jgi:hypothetical protein
MISSDVISSTILRPPAPRICRPFFASEILLIAGTTARFCLFRERAEAEVRAAILRSSGQPRMPPGESRGWILSGMLRVARPPGHLDGLQRDHGSLRGEVGHKLIHH